MLKSKHNLILPLFSVISQVPLAFFPFIIYIIFKVNIADLWEIELFITVLFLLNIWLVFEYILLFMLNKKIWIKDEHIEIKRFFGLFSTKYENVNLVISKNNFGKGGLILEADDGSQIIIGVKEYKNYTEIEKRLKQNIKGVDNIKIRYINKDLKIILILGFMPLLILFLHKIINIL